MNYINSFYKAQKELKSRDELHQSLVVISWRHKGGAAVGI